MSEYSVHGRRKQLLALLWVLNLAVTAQLLFSLISERGEFIQLDEASISPYGIHHRQANLSPAGDLQHSISSPMLFIAILCIYPTLVLIPFAMMSLAFGIYSPDSSSWGLGVALQGSSSILMFAGILFFVGATWEYFHLSKITLSFMLCVCLCFEMALGAFVSPARKSMAVFTSSASFMQYTVTLSALFLLPLCGEGALVSVDPASLSSLLLTIQAGRARWRACIARAPADTHPGRARQRAGAWLSTAGLLPVSEAHCRGND